MPLDPDIVELQKKQQALVDKALKLGDLSDGEAVARESKKLAEEAKRLEAEAQAVAGRLQAEADAKSAKYGVDVDQKPKLVKVRLTDEQRQRVLDDTGVRIEVVELEERREIVSERFMPEEHPHIIEMAARKKAERMKNQQAGQEKARENVDKALEDLEKGPADVQRMLAEKKKDPDFIANRIAED